MGELSNRFKKLYSKIKNNPADVRFPPLEKLMKAGGFLSEPGKGDHYNFYHKGSLEMLTVDTRGKRKPMKAVYVKKALKLFAKYNSEFIDD